MASGGVDKEENDEQDLTQRAVRLHLLLDRLALSILEDSG